MLQKWSCSANPRAYRSTAQRRSLTQKLHKKFNLLADLAQGLALSAQQIGTDVITEGKNEESGERALNKQNGVGGVRSAFMEKKRELT